MGSIFNVQPIPINPALKFHAFSVILLIQGGPEVTAHLQRVGSYFLATLYYYYYYYFALLTASFLGFDLLGRTQPVIPPNLYSNVNKHN